MSSYPKASSGDRYFPVEDPETRQHYVNVGVERYLAFHGRRRFVPFAEILEQFRRYGRLYDLGYRLRDSEAAAA